MLDTTGGEENVNENRNEGPLPSPRRARPRVSKEGEKVEPFYTAGGNVKWALLNTLPFFLIIGRITKMHK